MSFKTMCIATGLSAVAIFSHAQEIQTPGPIPFPQCIERLQQESAALKIQARYRGRLGRRTYSYKKNDRKAAITCKSQRM